MVTILEVILLARPFTTSFGKEMKFCSKEMRNCEESSPKKLTFSKK
jgi:hypothetical protein